MTFSAGQTFRAKPLFPEIRTENRFSLPGIAPAGPRPNSPLSAESIADAKGDDVGAAFCRAGVSEASRGFVDRRVIHEDVRVACVDRQARGPVVAGADAGPDTVCIRQPHRAMLVYGRRDLIGKAGTEGPGRIVPVLAAERKEPSVLKVERQARTGGRTVEQNRLDPAPI